MLSVSMHINEIAEHGKKHSSSSFEMRRDDTRFVLSDCYAEGWLGQTSTFYWPVSVSSCNERASNKDELYKAKY